MGKIIAFGKPKKQVKREEIRQQEDLLKTSDLNMLLKNAMALKKRGHGAA